MSAAPGRAVALLLLGAAAATAQTADRELKALRSHLALVDSVALAPAASQSLPSARPLRVRLAFGLDLTARANIVRWIEEWNRKDGRRHGAIEVVADDAPAELVLARYTERDKVRSRTVTGPELQPRTPGTRSTRSRFEINYVPVHGYVIDTRQPQSWQILWRHSGFTTLEETKGSGRELWDGLREMLKRREK